MAKDDFFDTVKELKVHDHICLVYETKDEQLNFVVPFIKIGLERLEKCIYVADCISLDIVEALREYGVDTDSAIRSGSLSILTTDEVYLKPGYFDVEWMLRFFKETVASAKVEGFKALRVVAEVGSFVEDKFEKFKKYEAKVNSFFSVNDILAICQYDRNRFSSEVILNAIHTHPIIIHGSSVCRNAYYVPPEELLRPSQTGLEVNRLLDNITVHEKTENALQKSRALLTSVVNSPDSVIIFALDTSYNYLSFNMAHVKEMRRIYGADIEIGRDILTYISREDDRLKARENYERVLKGERFVRIEKYGQPDRRFWYELVFNPIYDNRHHVAGFTVFCTDITERKYAEEALKQSEGRFRAIVQNAHVCIKEVDLNGRIISMNPAGLKMIGVTEECEVCGRFFLDYVSEKDRPRIADLTNKACNGHASSFEFEVNINDVFIYISSSLIPIKNSTGVVLRLMAISSDITERKKMEEALLKSEKLTSIGIITAGISHEFNNILAIISGKVQLLKMYHKDNRELAGELDIIKEAADDGAEISHKMLKFASTDQNDEKLTLSDIRDLMRQAISFTKPRWKNEAEGRGITYSVDQTGIKHAPLIMCNPTEMREVFVNIINNALDAMPEGGKASFSTWCSDDTVYMRISDTGDGIPEEVRKNIFDPFFSTKGVEGTGLGLSMAYGIIIRHGGQIEVNSEAGKGTAFTLQLPAADEEESQIVMSGHEQVLIKKKLRVLVVDDEDILCDLLDNFLSNCGHKVKTVNNGADAIAVTKTESFDLVLCDLGMPDIHGYDVIRAINKLEKRPKIGIISGWGEDLRPIEKDGVRVDFSLGKPFEFSELAKCINELSL